MEIHEPKPFQNWQAFLRDYVVIVLAIVTALGVVQTIRAIHHHDQVQEMRGALVTEMKGNVDAAKYILAQMPCTTRRLDELHRWIVSSQEGRPVKLLRTPEGPQSLIFRESTWHATPPGTFARMPLKQRIDFSAAYDGVKNLNEHLSLTYPLWTNLARLARVNHLSDNQLAQASSDIDQLRGLYGGFTYGYQSDWVDRSKRLGVDVPLKKGLADTIPASPVCQPLLAEEKAG